MAMHWRCLIGVHQWRHLDRQLGGRSSGNLPPGG